MNNIRDSIWRRASRSCAVELGCQGVLREGEGFIVVAMKNSWGQVFFSVLMSFIFVFVI